MKKQRSNSTRSQIEHRHLASVIGIKLMKIKDGLNA